MATDTFFQEVAYPYLFARETDPAAPDKVVVDSGGATKYGISARAYPRLNISGLTRDAARDLTYHDYWLPSGCGQLEDPWAVVILDTGFNMGLPSLAPIYAAMGERSVDNFLWARLERYRQVVIHHPSDLPYLPGWVRRVSLTRQEAARVATLTP